MLKASKYENNDNYRETVVKSLNLAGINPIFEALNNNRLKSKTSDDVDNFGLINIHANC